MSEYKELADALEYFRTDGPNYLIVDTKGGVNREASQMERRVIAALRKAEADDHCCYTCVPQCRHGRLHEGMLPTVTIKATLNESFPCMQTKNVFGFPMKRACSEIPFTGKHKVKDHCDESVGAACEHHEYLPDTSHMPQGDIWQDWAVRGTGRTRRMAAALLEYVRRWPTRRPCVISLTMMEQQQVLKPILQNIGITKQEMDRIEFLVISDEKRFAGRIINSTLFVSHTVIEELGKSEIRRKVRTQQTAQQEAKKVEKSRSYKIIAETGYDDERQTLFIKADSWHEALQRYTRATGKNDTYILSMEEMKGDIRFITD